MEKEAYKKLVISEMMRYIHLRERNYSGLTAESQAVLSIWTLMNSDQFSHRESSLDVSVPKPRRIPHSPELILNFTAHAHHGEPLTSSPDDRLIYSLTSGIPKSHFIVNHFTCREVQKPEWM